ncbi:MAG: hypothetical protein V4686_01305 [Patescibacteria group bacterium]
MHPIKISTIVSLAALFEELRKARIYSVAEGYTAIHVNEILEALHFLKISGYKVSYLAGDIATATKNDQELKIVTGKLKPHTAYKCSDEKTLNHIEKLIDTRTIIDFEVITYSLPDTKFRYTDVQHSVSEDIVRFLWSSTEPEKTTGSDKQNPPGDDGDPVPMFPKPPAPTLKGTEHPEE